MNEVIMHPMLEDIQKNIERLIALYEKERKQRAELEYQLSQKSAELDSCRKQISNLERQVDNLKLTEAFTAPSGTNSDAKEKIEKMIAEIDKCISLLER